MEPIKPYWFIWLDRHWRFGLLPLGLVIFLLLRALMGAFNRPVDTRAQESLVGLCLFFACINATGLTGTMAIIKQMELALDQLKPNLRVGEARFRSLQVSLSGTTSRRSWKISLIGLGLGFAQSAALAAVDPDFKLDLQFFGAKFRGLLTWFVMLHVIAALVQNAHMFARLGREDIEIDALRPQLLLPFATVPGFVLTLLSAVYLPLRPIWPVHVHRREAKASLLASTEAGIARWRETNPDRNFASAAVGDLVPILAFREHVRALPEWPFNLGLLGRWLF